MTSRTFNNYKTLREILDYNDDVIRRNEININVNHNQYNTGNDNNDNRKLYSLKTTSALSILNWNLVFSNKKMMNCMILMIITVLSQLVFSYIMFFLVSVEGGLVWFYISHIINLVFAYLLPLSILRDLDDVSDTPLVHLSSEIDIYKQLKWNTIIYFICLTISAMALYEVFTSGPFISETIDFQTGTEIKLDMTSFVKILQIISFQLTFFNFGLTTTNLFLTTRKIRFCFNRIEKMQNREDLEVMFNENIINTKLKNNFF